MLGYFILSSVSHALYLYGVYVFMSYVGSSPLIEFNGQWWEVDTRVSGIYTHLMRAILEQLFAMLSHHNKVLVFRFDLHRPDYTQTNKSVTDFLRRVSRRIVRHYKFARIGYCWVREQEMAQRQHYHFALILDGNKIQKPSRLWLMAKESWEFTDGTCWLPENPYYRIVRGNHRQAQEAILRLSYLAKGRGKGNKSAQTKSYGVSRIESK